MLSKNFKSNKIYQVLKWVEKNGNTNSSETVWENEKQARAYINKAAKQSNFAGAEIWIIETSQIIAAHDYKNNKYEIVNRYPNY